MRASFARPLSLGLFLLFSLLLCGLNTPATAQSGGITVANSSFETPVISSVVEYENGYAMRQAGVNPVWTITDYAGIGLAEYFNKDASGQGQVAPDGNQVGYVQSWHGTGSALWQAVSGLQAGQSYYVIVAAAQDGGNTGGIAMPVQVSLGAQSYTFTPTGTNYRDYTFGPFMGSAASQTLRFATVTQSTSVNAIVMLDNVRVVPASSAFAEAPGVPTPNFSFEAPTISNYDEFEDGYAMMQAGTNVGWTLSAYSGIGLAEYFNKDEPGRGQLAPDGSQVAYVQSYYSYAPGTISQTVSGFQPGQSYYLIVSAAQCSGNDVALPVVASLGGQTYMFTPSGTQYQDYTFGPVTATAASQTVSFMAVPQSASTAATVMLDNVRVVLSAAPFTPAGLSLYPATVTGGASSLGTVTLSSYAPPGGVVVTLQSDNPAASVPASVTVPGGQVSATFPVTTTDVNAATTATISATAGGVTQTATLNITQNLSLTAAATGSTKVTLYWNGISGASGYNVYRGTVSGGPYSLIAPNVSTPNNGPGRAGSFMYTDSDQLTTGTEYFYIVRAVQSGAEIMQSNENSATPDPTAIPWDTGDPVQIVAAVNATAANDLQPDVDDSGNVIPQQVGVLFIGGPDGVVYLGNLSNLFIPDQAYAAPGYVVGNALVGNDGTITSFADGPLGDSSINPAAQGQNGALGLWSDDLLSPRLTTADTYPYQSTSPPTGIYRKVESAPGFGGLSAFIGLPRSRDANAVHLLHHPSTSTAASGNRDVGKDYPSTGDIYTGGAVYSTNGTESSELDAGLQLTPDPNSNVSQGWSPIVSNRHRDLNPNNNKIHPATADKIYLDGSAHALPVGNQPGALLYKMHMVGEIHMQFLTPKSASVRDQSVRLHFSQAPHVNGASAEPIGVIYFDTYDPVTGNHVGSDEFQYLTLEYFGVLGWHKAHSSFIIKRVNSIAQTLKSPQAPGAPQANAPSGSTVKGYLADGSFIRQAPSDTGQLDSGASWGLGRPTDVALLSPTAGWQAWTNDATMTRKAGSYPVGNGAVSYYARSPFYFETNIGLTMK